MNSDELAELNAGKFKPHPAWTYNPVAIVAAIFLTAWYMMVGMAYTWDIYFAGDPENYLSDPGGQIKGTWIPTFAPASVIFGAWLEFLLVRRLGRRLRALGRKLVRN